MILFLDIDGVLNSTRSAKKFRSFRKFDPDCVAQLNRIVEETSAKIVISSVWRIRKSLKLLRNIFEEQGFLYPERIIGKTDFLNGGWREDEIKDWLCKNDLMDSCFVVVDDSVADLDRLKNRLVKTSFEVGLTSENADAIIDKLTEDL